MGTCINAMSRTGQANRVSLDEVLLGEASLQNKLAAGEAKIEDNPEELVESLSLMEYFEFRFNIVTL